MADRTGEAKWKQDLFLFIDLTDGEADLLRDKIAETEQSSRSTPLVINTSADTSNVKPSLVILYAPEKIAELSTALFSRLAVVLQDYPFVPVAVITDCSDIDFVNECYRRGISGVIGTTLSVAVAKYALQLVACGGVFVPAAILAAASKSTES